jgi:hypothetical protein
MPIMMVPGPILSATASAVGGLWTMFTGGAAGSGLAGVIRSVGTYHIPIIAAAWPRSKDLASVRHGVELAASH